MKFSIILKSSFVLMLFTVFSCSKTEENVPLVNIASLVLTSDSADAILVVNETVTFTVTGDDQENYNNQATFFVNGAEITGNTYAFDSEGDFEVYAAYAGINSNNLTFDVVSADERTLLLDHKQAFPNQPVTFSLIDADGIDTTADATFYVDGSAIAGNVYSSGSVALHEVYAEYELGGDTQVSATKNFEIFIAKRKVVLEDYTGTWCGYCPAVAAAAEEAHDATPHLAVVAIHETAASFPDPYHFPEVQMLKDAFGVNGLPAARINRTTNWNQPYAITDVTSIAGEDSDVAVGIKSQLSGNSLNVEVNVLFENGSNPGDKIVLYLTESGLIYDQVNYYNDDPTSPYYQLGDPIPNFVHNDVLRLSLSGIFGDAIEATGSYSTFTKNFSVTLPDDYNAANLHLVAMVVSDDNGARNAQYASVNEEKNYE